MAWTAKFSQPAVKKIFVREKLNRESESKEQQVVSISDKEMIFLDANTGGHKFS
jgi:hypothetical protein